MLYICISRINYLQLCTFIVDIATRQHIQESVITIDLYRAKCRPQLFTPLVFWPWTQTCHKSTPYLPSKSDCTVNESFVVNILMLNQSYIHTLLRNSRPVTFTGLLWSTLYYIGSQWDLKVPFKILAKTFKLIKCSLCELACIDSELNKYPLSAGWYLNSDWVIRQFGSSVS